MSATIQPMTSMPTAALPATGMPTTGTPMVSAPMVSAPTAPMMGAYGSVQPHTAPYYGATSGTQQPVYINSMSQLPVGAVPVSQQMLAQALGYPQAGAQMVQEPQGPSVIGSVLKTAGLGAAAGAAFGLIPFLPLGMFSGALIGGAAGAVLGLVKGLKAKKQAENEIQIQSQTQQQAAAVAAQVGAPGSATAAMEAKPSKGVVMSPEMRKKWAAKVRAEKAAAAAAAAKK